MLSTKYKWNRILHSYVSTQQQRDKTDQHTLMAEVAETLSGFFKEQRVKHVHP